MVHFLIAIQLRKVYIVYKRFLITPEYIPVLTLFTLPPVPAFEYILDNIIFLCLVLNTGPNNQVRGLGQQEMCYGESG